MRPRLPHRAGRLALYTLLLGGALAPAAWGQGQPQLPPPAASPADPSSDTLPAADWSDADWEDIDRWAAETAPGSEHSPAAQPEASPGDEFSSLELTRQGEDGRQRRIRVVRRSTDDATGIFTICGPQEGEPSGGPSVAVFSESGAGGVEITIDKNVIRVPLALVTQRERSDGTAGDGNIEAGGGQARFLEEAPADTADRLERCAVKVERQPAPAAVQVTQGRTQLTGQDLKYDEADGIARISGPVAFTRSAEGAGAEGNDLSGTASSIEVDVDRERTALVGDVVLNSGGGRVSRAARVEYDDAANLARLIGTPEQPAVTTRDGERLQAAEILYDLARDEAVARASAGVRISAEFTDGE